MSETVKVRLDEHIFVNGELCEAGEVIECPAHFGRELQGTRKGRIVTDDELAKKTDAPKGKGPKG